MLKARMRLANLETKVVGKVIPVLDVLKLGEVESIAVNAGPDEVSSLDTALELATELFHWIRPRHPNGPSPFNAVCDVQHGMDHQQA
jgi:hypothetical protein